jgi:predicted ATPase
MELGEHGVRVNSESPGAIATGIFAKALGMADPARLIAGVELGRARNPQQGVEMIKQGIAATRASGASSFISHSITLLADAYGMAGQPAAGLEWLDEAISIIEARGKRWYEAKIRRLRGDLLRAAGDGTTAEASFRDAIAVVIKQRAKLFELRASTSLSRLWREQGKRQQARELLAPVYG